MLVVLAHLSWQPSQGEIVRAWTGCGYCHGRIRLVSAETERCSPRKWQLVISNIHPAIHITFRPIVLRACRSSESEAAHTRYEEWVHSPRGGRAAHRPVVELPVGRSSLPPCLRSAAACSLGIPPLTASNYPNKCNNKSVD